MYQVVSRNKYQYLLQAIASDGSMLEELIAFLTEKRDAYDELLHKYAVAALDDKTNVPYALRQAGAVTAIEDLIFTLSSYSNKNRSK